MGKWRRTPAIFAGLAGGAVWSVPVLAGAMTVDEVLVTLDDLLASPVAYFFIGLAAGAAVTGVAVGVSGHRTRKRLSRQLEDALAENDRLRTQAAPLVIRISSPGVVLEPLSANPAPAQEEVPPQAEERPLVGSAPEAGPLERPERAELDSTAHLPRITQAATKPAAAVDLPDLDEPDAEPAQVSQGLGVQGESAYVPQDRSALRNRSADGVLGMARPVRVRGRLDNLLPTLDDEASRDADASAALFELSRPSAPLPSSAPATSSRRTRGEDLEHVAEEYVRKTKASERERQRSKGVRAILSERLRGNVMSGLPVIERADGSTADIGTSWWTREVGSTHSFAPLDPSTTADLPPVTAAPDPMSTAALRAREMARAERNARAAGLSSATEDTSRLDATSRAAVIASRLSSVDMSLYPEEQGSAGAPEEDMFEQALRALDAQDGATTVVTTADASSTPTPLSEGLVTGAVVSASEEPSKDEIDARTDEHVDFLVRDEMERNRARRSQHNTHSILTVFEGTGDLSDAKTARPGRHFAKPSGHASTGRREA